MSIPTRNTRVVEAVEGLVALTDVAVVTECIDYTGIVVPSVTSLSWERRESRRCACCVCRR